MGVMFRGEGSLGEQLGVLMEVKPNRCSAVHLGCQQVGNACFILSWLSRSYMGCGSRRLRLPETLYRVLDELCRCLGGVFGVEEFLTVCVHGFGLFNEATPGLVVARPLLCYDGCSDFFQHVGFAVLLVEVAPLGNAKEGAANLSNLMDCVVAGRGDHDIRRSEVVERVVDPAGDCEIGEICFVSFFEDGAEGEPLRVREGPAAHGQGCIRGALPAAAADCDDHFLVGR